MSQLGPLRDCWSGFNKRKCWTAMYRDAIKGGVPSVLASRSCPEYFFSPPSMANETFPPELLLEIFGHGVALSVERTWNDPIHPPLRVMLALSQVCRQWRNVALENSTLWKECVDMGRPDECIKEILHRSGARPLHLTFFTPPPPQRHRHVRGRHTPSRVARKMLDTPHREHILSRTRSLHATFPATNADKVFDRFRQHLPLMETISLELECRSAVLRDESLFNGQEWMVRSLSLKRCTIRLQPNALPFLQELRVELPSPHAFPCLETWLSVLGGLPQLRVFELVESFGLTEMEPFRDAQDTKIHLPKLERLVLKASDLEKRIGAPLLDALIVPPSCALTLGTPLEQWPSSYNSLLAILSKRYSAYDNALGYRLDLTITGNALAMRTRGPSTLPETFIYFYFPGGCKHFDFNPECTLSNAGLIFQKVLDAFRKPLAAVRCLNLKTYVHEDKKLNPFLNLRLLRLFPCLELIELNIESIFGGFPPMDILTTYSPDLSDPRIFWITARRELVVANVNFASSSTPLLKLRLALMLHFKLQGRRRKSKLPLQTIQTVSLRWCTGFRKCQLVKLEELVAIVYVECKVLDGN